MSTPGNVADFEPGLILRALEAHHVRYVVIGAIAAIAAGAPILTTDLDVTPARSDENLERLALALRDLDAKLRSASAPTGVPFPIEAELLATADSWTLTTRSIPTARAGIRRSVDVLRDPFVVRILQELESEQLDHQAAPRAKRSPGCVAL